MPFQVIQRKRPERLSNTIGRGILGATEGFLKGQELSRTRGENAISNAYKMAQTEELLRKTKSLNAPAPLGYVRDPYTGDLKEDFSYSPPTPGNLTPTEFDRYGRPKKFEDVRAGLEREIEEKDLMEQAKALPRVDQALQAVTQLQNLYKEAVSPKSVRRGDLYGGFSARVGGIPKTLGALIGARPELKQYINQRKGFSGLLAKGGFGEAGMLTKNDIDRISRILPSEYSTKQEAVLAWKEIDDLLSSARRRFEEKKSRLVGGVLPRESSNEISQMSDEELKRMAGL